jgi:hypothetical protein
MTTTTWNTNAGDGNWSTAGNWTNGVPDATKNAVITGSGPVTIDADGTFLTLDASAYAGTWDQHDYNALNAHGNVTLGAGMSIVSGIVYILFNANAIFNTNGAPSTEGDYELAATCTLTLGSDVLVDYFDAGGVGCVVALGTHKLLFHSEGGAGSASLNSSGGTFTWGAGGGIDIVEPSGLNQNASISIPASVTVPPLTVSLGSSGTLGLNDGGAWTVTVASLVLTGGAAVNIVANVLGSAVAHNATITGSDFSAGSQLDASDGCVDGGGNTNVTFVVAPTGPTATFAMSDMLFGR